MNIIDDLQASMDNLFGVCNLKDKSIRKFKKLSDLYSHYYGDSGFTGVFNPGGLPSELRGTADINSTTLPLALANTLNRFLSAGYKKINYFEDILISQKMPVTYLYQGNFVQMGCWGDLPDVDPEADNYPDMPDITEAENPFDPIQKGCVIPITRKVIVNDDMALLQKLMDRLGLVARKAHARYIWNMWINNATCNDGADWFSAGHGNLGSGALIGSSVTTAISALAAMVEPGPSTDVMGIDLSKPQFHLVAAPSAWDDAVKVNQRKYHYTTNDLTTQNPNPCYRLFGDRNERIATPPFLTGSDWGVIRDKEEVPIIEMQYWDGKEEPEIFYEKDPSSDMAIRGDFFALKCRFEFGGNIGDYRSGYKSVP